MKKYFNVKVIGLGIVIVYALYLVLTGLVAPFAGRRIAQNSLTDALKRNTQIESISFNPFTLEARVKNFVIESKVPGENLASIQLIYVNLSAASLFRLAPVISGVQVTSPHFRLHLNKDNTLNISDLIEGDKKAEAPEPEKKENMALFGFKVANVTISDGALIFTDHIRSVTHTVEKLNLDLPLISTMEKDLSEPIQAGLSFLLNQAGVDINLSGTPFDTSRKMAVAVKLDPLDLNPLAAYIELPEPYKFKSVGNLAVSLSGEYEIHQGKTAADQKMSVKLNTRLNNVDLESTSGAPLVSCPLVEVDALSDNVFSMQFLVNNILLDQVSLFVERDGQGRINLVPVGTEDPSPGSQTSESDTSGLDTGRQDNTPADEPQTAAALDADKALSDSQNRSNQAEPVDQILTASAALAETTAADAIEQAPAPDLNQSPNQDSTQDSGRNSDPASKANTSADQTSGADPAPLVSFTLPVNVKITQAAVKNLHIHFNDKMVSPEVLKTIDPLDLILSDVEIGPKIAGTLDLNILTGDTEKVKVTAGFSLDKVLDVDGSFALSGVAMENYRSYLRPYLGDNITLENLDTSLDFKVGLSGDSLDVKVANGSISLDKFSLSEQGKKTPVVQFEQLAVSQISCDLAGRQAGVGLVALHKADVRVNRDKSGTMDILTAIEQAVTSQVKTGEKTTTSDSGQEKPDSKDVKASTAENKEEEAAPSSSNWTAVVNKTVLDQCRVQFVDNAGQEPVNMVLADMGVTVENVSTKKGEKATFKASMTNKNNGKISLDGDFDISGPSATVNIDLNRIDVNTAEPYFTDFLKISIAKGYLNTKGTVAVIPGKTADESPTITYKGRASLNDFLSRNKVDDKEFFSCKSFYATGMNISVNPMKVVIKEVALTDFYQRAILDKKGRLNYKQILAEKAEDGKETAKADNSNPPTQKTADQMPDIRIDAIRLQNGHINFSDYFTKPNFTSNMTQIAGSLTGLSSKGKEHANLVLKGVHGDHAPLDITGQLDPLKNNRFVDLTVSFKNIELPRFSVYTGKYLGREIEKGKLILDLHYNIDNDKLHSSNRVLFDQLTLGKTVKSEDATSLPLDLAFSLLKDTNGQINLDLPVDGDISDPKFHFGKVLVTVFRNVILSVTTKPFKFLGSLVGIGNGQDLGFVGFDPGVAQLDPEQKDKLDKLALVLNKKTDLKLEIKAQYNKVSDAEQFRREKYETLILSMDKNRALDSEAKFSDIPEEELAPLIEAAYEKSQSLKPRDEFGKIKALTVAEKEKLLITDMSVDEGELNDLALARSSRIIDYLTQTGKIDTNRLFVTEPDPVPDTEQSAPKVKTTFLIK